MQLTANFVVLATALAYSTSSVLALPVDSAYAARDVEYDVEARDVGSSDVLDHTTRDLYDMFLEARGYYDQGLDTRELDVIEAEAREYFEDLEARAATPVTPATPAAPTTSTLSAGPSPTPSVKPTTPSTSTPVNSKMAAYRKALADPNDPGHADALQKQKLFKIYKAALADPNDPNHAKALKFKSYQKALRDPKDPGHKLLWRNTTRTLNTRRL